ncbi:alpha/beta hydrolase [Caulobacter sp. NIBR2454]|uniref:alpha/beta hydrolase n=1 Tax=Caulobacter sp. NIBR2454 TaxID=3015996 RepID=UPI0022B6D6FB|nr:alpha/beta hydrolase-fold protein [Caulobacter sp. NIBR2454]
MATSVLGVASVVLALLAAPIAAAAQSRLQDFELRSSRFEGNRIGVSPVRKVTAYLPDGYDGSARRYPVIYYLSNLFETNRSLFDANGGRTVLDAAIKAGTIPPVIVVSADFSTPLGTSFYANSPVTGNWSDFLAEDLPTAVDGRFRTLPTSASRGLLGDRMGGYGAIRTAMLKPGVFGSVFALHPIGTGVGIQTMHSRPNLEKMAAAKALSDLDGDGFSQIFTAMYQAFLPNPANGPLFVDMPARRENGQLIVDSALTAKLQNAFLLDRLLPAHADNLKALRGLQLEWGRFDGTTDHVVSNRAFSHLLEEYGIANEAEEYRGWWGETHWTQNGRVATRALPFFARTLAFEKP